MRVTVNNKKTIRNATILMVVLFLFGTVARANVTASPAALNFGNQAMGTTSAPISVTVENNNNSRLEIKGVSVSTAQFSYSGPSLPFSLTSGKSATFSVRFTPTAGLSYSGTLIFTRQNGSRIDVSLNGTGINSTPVQRPAISMQPVSQTVTAGQAATFTVAATGTSPMTYQWSKNGAAIGGATSSAYMTPAETTSDNNAQFTVTVSNSAGSATSNAAVLTVNAPAVAPSISSQPSSKTVTAGQTATFSVTATGTSPMSYQWSKNGAAIGGATSASYTTPAETTSDNNAQFTATVSNSAGRATSNAAVLTVNAPVVAPAISSQPASQTITAGQTATFDVAATGTSPMTFQWMKNGAAISGATASSYTTPAETTSDNRAQFTVTVSNNAGNATSDAAILTVNTPVVAPAITSQPSNKSVLAGQTATFSVTATGTATLTYQWSKNGATISGATTSTYTTPAETTADNNAQFTVAVSNSTGSVTSSPATLTVGATTLILNASSTALNFGSVTTGSNSSQNVTLTNAGNSNVTISNVSVSGAGFNASGASGLIMTPGQTTTLSATFTPAAAGSVIGSITVASNATNSPDTIALSGTGVAQVNHSVTLSWIPSTSSVMGYNTYSSKVSGGPYTKVNSSLDSAMTYTDNSVQAGQTYYYVVTSVNSQSMESTYSTEVSALVP